MSRGDVPVSTSFFLTSPYNLGHAGEGGLGLKIIYADTLFLINAVMDYLLLLGAARLAGEPLRRLRFLAGAVLGGGYAVAVFLPGFGFLGHPLCKLSFCALMLLCAYGGSRRLWRQSILFLGLCCGLGGGIIAIGMLRGHGIGGGEYPLYGPDLKTVLLSAALCYTLLTLFLQGAARHSRLQGELVPVRLELGDRSVTLTALTDTGNTLTDPLSGQSVMVADGEALLPLFPEGKRPDPTLLKDPVAVMELLPDWGGRLRIIPYRAVGVDRGLLLVLKTDRAVIGEETREGALAALSPTPVSGTGAWQALIRPSL